MWFTLRKSEVSDIHNVFRNENKKGIIANITLELLFVKFASHLLLPYGVKQFYKYSLFSSKSAVSCGGY
jgi:hypothetical protein